VWFIQSIFLIATASAHAQDAATAARSSDSPHVLVREGNALLESGRADDALQKYQAAEQLKPEAREIGFVEWLAHFDLKEFDAARAAFERAGPFESDAFADDILYSVGATDHAEALESIQTDPKRAVELLESAMQRYRDVLSRRSDHQAARQANAKAASMRRQLKQMMQEQQQQQNGQGDQQDQKDENEQKQPSQAENEAPQDEQQQNPQDQQQPQSSDEEKREQEQSSASDAANEDEQESSSPDSDQQDDQSSEAKQAARKEERENASREQAERKLREMVQAIRDRQKRKPERTEPVRIAPVEKDW
jgi:Ca-activated chloride channel family protein